MVHGLKLFRPSRHRLFSVDALVATGLLSRTVVGVSLSHIHRHFQNFLPYQRLLDTLYPSPLLVLLYSEAVAGRYEKLNMFYKYDPERWITWLVDR